MLDFQKKPWRLHALGILKSEIRDFFEKSQEFHWFFGEISKNVIKHQEVLVSTHQTRISAKSTGQDLSFGTVFKWLLAILFELQVHQSKVQISRHIKFTKNRTIS